MSMEIYYEDIMDNIDNKNLREKLIQLVDEHKIIVVKGLSSAQRHIVYGQMYYPLKFEKIVFNENDKENTDIRIYNCKIKQKEKKQNENNKNKTYVEKTKENKEEKTKETKNEDEYILEDLEDSEHSEEESSGDSVSNSYYESKSEDSYLTEEDEQLTRLEDIGSQILERVVDNEKKIDRTISRVNLVIIFNIIGWIMLYALDPVRVIYIRTTECEVF